MNYLVSKRIPNAEAFLEHCERITMKSKSVVFRQGELSQDLVRREWPGTVHVHVTEEQPIARWGEAAYINPQGVVFDGASFDRYAELPQLWSEHSAPVALIEQFKLFQMLLTPHGLGFWTCPHRLLY